MKLEKIRKLRFVVTVSYVALIVSVLGVTVDTVAQDILLLRAANLKMMEKLLVWYYELCGPNLGVVAQLTPVIIIVLANVSWKTLTRFLGLLLPEMALDAEDPRVASKTAPDGEKSRNQLEYDAKILRLDFTNPLVIVAGAILFAMRSVNGGANLSWVLIIALALLVVIASNVLACYQLGREMAGVCRVATCHEEMVSETEESETLRISMLLKADMPTEEAIERFRQVLEAERGERSK